MFIFGKFRELMIQRSLRMRKEHLQGRKSCREFDCVIIGRHIYMEIRKNSRDSIILTALTYGNEFWTRTDAKSVIKCY